MKNKIIILGGGHGDGKVAAQIFTDAGFEIAGVLNDNLKKGERSGQLLVLGPLEAWSEFDTDLVFFPALHKVKQMQKRSARIIELGIPLNRIVSVIHPTACVPDDLVIGKGTLVGQHVTIQPGAKIGNFVSIRAGANIGHDAAVDDFAYIGPNATMSGFSSLCRGAHMGPNSVLIEFVKAGEFSVIGAGSVATNNIPERQIVLGVPARKLRNLPIQ